MTILKIITSVFLTILPLSVLVRDWKYNDKRTKKHHYITITIIIIWVIASIPTTLFVLDDSEKINELIEGKNQLLAKVTKHQADLNDKDIKIRELKENMTEIYFFNGIARRTHGAEITLDSKLNIVYKLFKDYKDKKNYTSLKKLSEEQIKACPDWPTPYLFLGVALSNTGNIKKGRECFEKFIKIAPNDTTHGYENALKQANGFIKKIDSSKK